MISESTARNRKPKIRRKGILPSETIFEQKIVTKVVELRRTGLKLILVLTLTHMSCQDKFDFNQISLLSTKIRLFLKKLASNL